MNANMGTNHIAHRYRHTGKEVHLLSEPSELRPLKAMAHRHTRKEDHLLSEPSELRPLKAMAHRYTRKEDHLLSGPDHLNSNRLRTQELRSLIQHTSSSQDKNTADSQKQIKLSFRMHLFTMMIETLSGTILSIKFHLTLSS